MQFSMQCVAMWGQFIPDGPRDHPEHLVNIKPVISNVYYRCILEVIFHVGSPRLIYIYDTGYDINCCQVKKMQCSVQCCTRCHCVLVPHPCIPPLLQNHFSIAAVPIHPSTHSMRVGSVFKISDWQIWIQILNSHFGQPIVYGWAAYSRLCQLLGKMQ